ncbi:dTDP-4-dehydrorhamnose reductase [Flavobacterium rivuli WB 3.3-2 = DSM 21788]|uniref:dTDP-4-dehydrorhamnose reductase n=1 Tax=Flavobacterium rivuli WB 3.3-2 = DSM 21788 TaxID=1121895 RepID=A0A0A2M0M4_9FLAO|nr:dTDP-4-dehydrorhamnose reductase [Flavobacterium rivuli]KGO85819.1 dTDP-4-dehydrorhamnose reductase [Flavobacterium rivuli WB 3.3-2 = DSM 21788]
MVVLVTGATGQLGQALKAAAPVHNNIQFYFAGSAEADVTNAQSLHDIFDKIKPQYCINTAAYTAVDKAESEPEKAHAVNVAGAANIARTCKAFNTVLIHISTDFVFDGTKKTPYNEDDTTNPQSVYGTTKRDGEIEIQKIIEQYYVVRTSWVYSQYGSNFMKTMLRLAAERSSLSVVNDQVGTPTNANSLANTLIAIIAYNAANKANPKFGTYHFSDEGQCSWYDFAKKIFEVNKITIDLRPITTKAYPTPAKRPAYSVLNKQKIKTSFAISIPDWQDSLENNIEKDRVN